VDLSAMAKLRNCRDGTPLQGAGCTNCCPDRRTCHIKRQPLLLFTNHTKGQLEINPKSTSFRFKEFISWHSGHGDVVRFLPDSQINLDDNNTDNNMLI